MGPAVPGSRATGQILAKQLGISEHQLSYITPQQQRRGASVLWLGGYPFTDRFPKGEIYDLLTTRPEDLKNDAGA